MVQRLLYWPRHCFVTKSNQHRLVKTPGGKLVYRRTKKTPNGPICPATGKSIRGSSIVKRKPRLSRQKITTPSPRFTERVIEVDLAKVPRLVFGSETGFNYLHMLNHVKTPAPSGFEKRIIYKTINKNSEKAKEKVAPFWYYRYAQEIDRIWGSQ